MEIGVAKQGKRRNTVGSGRIGGSGQVYVNAPAAPGDGLAILDAAGRFVFVNETHVRIHGYEVPGDLIGQTWKRLYGADELRRFEVEILPAVNRDRHWQGETVALRRDGTSFPQQIFLDVIDDGGLVCVVRDLDEVGRSRRIQSALALDRQSAAEALRESEERFRTLADTAPCAIFIYQGSSFRYANDATAAISGYSRAELEKVSLRETVHPDIRELIRQRGLARRKGAASFRHEIRILRKDGEVRWLDFSAGAIEFEGKPAVLGMGFDITERKRAEEQIKNLAYHDALTGLPNRVLFADRLRLAMVQAHRQGQKLGILFLDLDRFKIINDSLGHSLGDRILQVVAERVQGAVREGDTVARQGGDEFTLLLPGLARAEDAARVAEKILDSLRQTIRIDGREFFITGSVGITLYPDDGVLAETLVKNADAAMYRAKDQGRDTYQLYAAAMNETAVERLALENSLRKVLARQELVLYYQPLLDLASGEIYGVEALLRWERPGWGLVLPDEFIPLAEVTGVIVPIGPWVWRTACEQVKRWQSNGHSKLRLSVNLSARQFHQPDVAAQVTRALDETGFAPENLDLEITESYAMQNPEAAIQTLRELKQVGVGLSIDDFGVGHSSLSYLKRLPIDTLKIDRSFIRDITTDPDDAAIVTAVLAMARTLKLRVVAEGVETEEQRAFLVAHGCDSAQGWLFSRAVPAEECARLLR
jgi:diguanylate cyclase (GGDEF)-like protein/PAS domain S-box-containing protein